jgi:hypothetical protein
MKLDRREGDGGRGFGVNNLRKIKNLFFPEKIMQCRLPPFGVMSLN